MRNAHRRAAKELEEIIGRPVDIDLATESRQSHELCEDGKQDIESLPQTTPSAWLGGTSVSTSGAGGAKQNRHGDRRGLGAQGEKIAALKGEVDTMQLDLQRIDAEQRGTLEKLEKLFSLLKVEA